MKLATFEIDSPLGRVRRIGAVLGEQLVDLNAAYALCLAEEGEERPYDTAAQLVPPDMIRFFEAGADGRAAAESAVALVQAKLAEGRLPTGPDGQQLVYDRSSVRLLAPVPEPPTIFSTMNSDKHMLNALEKFGLGLPKSWEHVPAVYRSSSTAVAGPDDPILWPSYTEQLDYELECGVYIGRRGSDISADEAWQYVAAFTIFNDVSARDVLPGEVALYTGPARGKCFVNGNVFGPWAVTPDEIPDPANLRMVARVNGEVWSEGNIDDIHWSFPQLIEHLSREEVLRPGDFISSGCIAFGSGLELDRWIQPGDVVELEVEGIGVLRNRVERRQPVEV